MNALDVAVAAAAREPADAPLEVVVVGAINVDLVVAADRLPGPGETVVGGGLSRHGGGKGANAAVAAARAGALVRLVGAVGDDDLGRRALAELTAEGVVVDDVTVLAGEATGVALIVVSAEGENQIAVAPGANVALDAVAVGAALGLAIPRAGCVVVSTEISVGAIAAAVEAAAAAGVPCVLNPAPVVAELASLLACGPIVTPNVSECWALAAAVAGSSMPGGSNGSPEVARPGEEGLVRAARSVAARTGAPVIVTLGGEGVLFIKEDGDRRTIPPPPTIVVDTTGAGDTFNGILGARIARGDGLAAAVTAAAAGASLSVSRAGARDGMPDAGSIDAAVQDGRWTQMVGESACDGPEGGWSGQQAVD